MIKTPIQLQQKSLENICCPLAHSKHLHSVGDQLTSIPAKLFNWLKVS